MIRYISRAYDLDGNLTHVMCCWCFHLVPVGDLYVDPDGCTWDRCGSTPEDCPPMEGP